MDKYEVVFESERIYFVKVNEYLINDYLKMINDEEVQKGISNRRGTYGYEGEVKWVKKKLENNEVAFSMIEKETNEFIGNIEMMNIKDGTGELGIAITPEKQNKHYGTEAIKALLHYSYDALKLNKIVLDAFNHNKRAINCYKNVGFVECDQDEERTYMTHVR